MKFTADSTVTFSDACSSYTVSYAAPNKYVASSAVVSTISPGSAPYIAVGTIYKFTVVGAGD